jgi:hypothetical protein
MGMLRIAEINMAETVSKSDIVDFLSNAAWAVRSTYHMVLKASSGAAIFGWDMLFDVPFIADWNKIGRHRQHQTNRNTALENNTWVKWDYKIGNKVMVKKDGILCKSESLNDSDPWTKWFIQMEQSGFTVEQNLND